MKKEDMMKAATLYADDVCKGPRYRWGHEQVAMVDFIEGANWRINSVWHDANEMPDLGEAIIIELFGKVWDYGTYDVSDSIHPKAKWAYMNDLIPSKED